MLDLIKHENSDYWSYQVVVTHYVNHGLKL